MKLWKNRTVLGIFCIAVSLIICFAITPLVNAGLSPKATIVRFTKPVKAGKEIEAKYGFKVHTAYIAEVKRDLGLPMYDALNAVEELKQPRKHPTAEKVEAIKDALKHFGIV